MGLNSPYVFIMMTNRKLFYNEDKVKVAYISSISSI
jgi:hypothetical protein